VGRTGCRGPGRSSSIDSGRNDARQLVQDRVLNHKDRTVGGIYDRHSYDREKRAALEGWARELTRITSGTTTDNIVTLVH
jgi:hypothetical protein